MHMKLTPRLDRNLRDRLIGKAKRRAKEAGRSVSSLVASFLAALDIQEPRVRTTPRVRSLRGLLAGARVSEQDYHRHLEEKHP
jgi:hypothetical protein